jgi:hypothetical protein
MSAPGVGCWALADHRGRLVRSWGRYVIYEDRRAADAARDAAPSIYGDALAPYHVQAILLTRCSQESTDDDTV